MENKMISYAMDCASYIMSNTKGIDAIILHGSVARGDYDEESDVDLFIDSSNKKMKEETEKALENYYKTQTYKNWVLKGIKNHFSLISGKLEGNEWKSLKRAIMNTGIILYGKYKSSPDKLKQYMLCSFENIQPDKKRIALYRKLFGFTQKKRMYAGLINEWGALKIGKGTLLIPLEHANRASQFFKKKGISVKVYDIWSDTSFT